MYRYFKKLILPTVGIFFVLALVSCTPNIPDISESIEEINRIDDGLEQIDTEIEDLETELENKE